MNEEKIKAVLSLLKEATQNFNLMAEALRCTAMAAKQSHELHLIGLQAVLQEKELPSEPKKHKEEKEKVE